jgi:hypothetical protein
LVKVPETGSVVFHNPGELSVRLWVEILKGNPPILVLDDIFDGGWDILQ